jgi:enoyl-CoA hydratase/carnithine racemase
VISAAGPDFCKGMDFDFVLSRSSSLKKVSAPFVECLMLISSSSKPVIGCVEGTVAGGGVGLVAACDLVIANESASFTLPEVIVGMIPALITPFLLRRMAPARVQYLALSSRTLSAMEAKTSGLVDELAEGGIHDVLRNQLQRLFRSSPAGLLEVKRYFDRLRGDQLRRDIQTALEQFDAWVEQPGVIESVRTFAEGFTPPWFQKYKERRDAEKASS